MDSAIGTGVAIVLLVLVIAGTVLLAIVALLLMGNRD